MSIETDTITTVSVDKTVIENSPSTEVTLEGSYCVNSEALNEITAVRKEYSIVGDAFYAGVNSSTAPTWLTDLINNVVSSAVAGGLTDYDLLVQDVRNAIDSINIAKNSYVEQINFTSLVDGIIGVHLDQLNTTYDNKFATITNMDLVRSDSESALAQSVSDLQVEFGNDINSRITTVQNAFASADSALADSIDSLQTAFTDQESNLAGTALAVTGLQTYVGLDGETSLPNGLGLLSRLSTLEKQSDGVVEYTSGTYDVMSGVEEENTDKSNDLLLVDALPYALWTEMSGAGVPVSTTRSYMDYSADPAASATIEALEGTLYTNTSSTDVDLDRYYRLSNGVWEVLTESLYTANVGSLRASKVADVYIQYGEGNSYVRSYKFIKVTPDETSPLSTDSEGYTWSVVTDTDSQQAYALALSAQAMADGKVSHFFAWEDGENGIEPTSFTYNEVEAEYLTDADGNYLDGVDGDITTAPAEYVETVPAVVSDTVSADYVALWFSGGILYKKGTGVDPEATPTWADKEPVPTESGTDVGIFIAVGDLLTTFDPITRDTTVYWFNGTTWQTNSPKGIVSKSKWFVDLDNAVYSKHGHIASSMNSLSVTNKAYTDNEVLKVESKFAYDSKIFLDGKYYNSGFGMDSTGVTQVADGLTEETAFDSEFWVNAERFVLKSPSHPEHSAVFSVDSTGIRLSLDNTEATRNEHKGPHDSSLAYLKGDIVTHEKSSYIAIDSVDVGIDILDSDYWVLFAGAGTSGSLVDYLFTRSDLPPDPPPAAGWHTNVVEVPAGTGDLWSIKETVVDEISTYSDKRIIEDEIVREVSIYSYSTPDSVTEPTESTYNFTTGSLTVGNTSWMASPPSVLSNGHRVWVCIALVEGNRTETAKPVIWSTPSVYSYRKDGVDGNGGDTGGSGSRGTAMLTASGSYSNEIGGMSQYALNDAWYNQASATQQVAIEGDTLVLTNTHPSYGWTHIFTYNSLSTWVATGTFTVQGNQVVTGTLNGNAISSNTRVTAGSGNDVAILSGEAGTDYRFWAGASDPTAANFSVDKTGHVVANSGSIGGAEILNGNLTVDTLNIKDGAVTVATAVNTPTISEKVFNIINVLDETYSYESSSVVMYSFALSVQRDGDATGNYDSVTVTVNVYQGGALIKQTVHGNIYADASASESPRFLLALAGSASLDYTVSNEYGIRVMVEANVSTQNYNCKLDGFMTNAKK